MAEHHTIADSKRAFHQAFPHVIAPLYRRIADELLVELHLLSHQVAFKPNALFAVGLNTVFTRFTEGYRPEAHTAGLLSALCSSNGFDAAQLKEQSDRCLKEAADHSRDAFSGWIKGHALEHNAHYSRLMGVGLFALLEAAGSSDGAQDPAERRGHAVELAADLGLPADRVDKDLTLFSSNSERMEQAVELMKETLAAERRKKEKRLAETAQGSDS
ncbi:MAG: photosystem II biogenesis protein Psp29 [Synechococcus sp. BS307-5m-G38]|nr:photosystem II biogenesis protein Psp29 [Synechococcus sp. BS307-5m-G38]